MSRPLNVLLVEDNPADAELVLRELRRAGFAPEWHRVETPEDYAANLHAGLDIVLSDFALPGFSGPRALDLLIESGLDIPFIIISGTIGEDAAVAAMRQGAGDYLLKDRLGRIGPAIEQALEKAALRRKAKRTEARVRELADMLDHAHDAIIVRDIHTRCITYWNEGAERLYGWTSAEALGRDIAELLFFDLGVPDTVSRQLIEHGEWRGESRQRTKAGAELIVSGHATLMRDAAGAPKSSLTINIDLTEQKSLEAQFLRAQRMEGIGTLASGVAHDLNNILCPIMMSVPMLRSDVPAQLKDEILEAIEINAQRGADIVKQVLTFARGVEGKRVLVQPVHLVKEMAAIARQTFPKSVAVIGRYPEFVWLVEGDPTQLHQVLLNLCVNARDAMPDGGELVIAAENFTIDEEYAAMVPEAKPGPYVVIAVSDNGAGIPREIIEKIFDPFFTTKELGKGTGLGLSTLIGIVKSHGGFVTVNSEQGRGTTFKVFLPSTGGVTIATAIAEPAPLALGNGQTILVVEDEKSVAKITQTMLEKHGYHALLAADGTEALTLFVQHSGEVKAVLTDVVMPYMDGAALTRALRKMSPKTPVIISTGALCDTAREAELKSIGVKVILKKPYTTDKLLAVLRATLDGAAIEED